MRKLDVETDAEHDLTIVKFGFIETLRKGSFEPTLK